MSRRSVIALGVAAMLGAVLISVAGRVDLFGISKIVRPVEEGVGTRCVQGDAAACESLAAALCATDKVRCTTKPAGIEGGRGPRINEGGGRQSGTPPGQPTGGNPPPEPPGSSPPPKPPPAPPPPNPPPPPRPPPPKPGPVKRVCNLLPIECPKVPGLPVP